MKGKRNPNGRQVSRGATAGVLIALALLSVTPQGAQAGEPIVASSVSVGQGHACALLASGQVACWGDNQSGELGDGTWQDRYVPTIVPGLNDVVSVSAGWDHTCAVRVDGQALCWGSDQYEQLGNGTDEDSSLVPVPVVGLGDAVGIEAGESHTCAVLDTGQIACWGLDNLGQLGDGTGGSGYSSVPVIAQGPSDAKGVTTGFRFSCAVRGSGKAVCWGNNSDGQIGDSTSGVFATRYVPTEVQGLSDLVSISAGTYHTCGIRATGQAVCWGNGSSGQLGNGTKNQSTTAVNVQGLNDAKSISAGYYGTCAVRSSGQALCWGPNQFGQIGDGTVDLVAEDVTPTPVLGLTDAESISTNGQSACAVRPSGQVVCWGYNGSGTLGDGTTTNRLVPTATASPVSVFTLTVNRQGDGTGAVRSQPTGVYCGVSCPTGIYCGVSCPGKILYCGTDCSRDFVEGTQVTLTAEPDTGSSFAGWTGACSGTGDCQVTMNEAKSVAATFAKDPPPRKTLTVSTSGDGSGTVTSTPAAIDCGVTCSASLEQGTKVTLTATPASGSNFGGWSGACSGTGDCQVTMSEAKAVTATFAREVIVPPPDPAFSITRVAPRLRVIKRGKRGRFKVFVKNTGTVATPEITVCSKVRSKLVRRSGCVPLGPIDPGATSVASFRISVLRKARKGKKVKVRFRASGAGMETQFGYARVKVK